jgi:WD40 repeat protein
LKINFNGIISIRETLTGREIANFAHPSYISSILFTSDGKYLITSSGDYYGTIVVWDISSKREVARILNGNPASLALSPDERYLIAGGTTTRIWDLQSDRPQVEVRGVFTDNMSFITRRSYLQSKNEISHVTYANAGFAKFSPDGRYILTTGCNLYDCNEDHILIGYWRIEDLAAEACRRLPRNFTQAEWGQYFPNEEYRATCPNLPIDTESTPMP